MSNVETYRIDELNLDMIQPSTETYMNPEQGGSKLILVGKPGCFIAGTPVLMYNGNIKNVEDVQVGEQVMGPDSFPRTVLELCRNTDEMFKIIPDKGESYTVNLKHKLVLVNNYGKEIEISVEDFLLQPAQYRKQWKLFRKPVDFLYWSGYCSVNLPSEPYMFGLNYGYDLFTENTIPIKYKFADRYTRLHILAGIIDSCGNYDYNCFIIPYNEDITFLARSLGFLVERESNINKIYGMLNSIPCKNHKNIENQDYSVSEFKILHMGYDQYYGFTITGDHRFLLGSFDVVRNTGKTTLIASILYSKKHIIPVGLAMSGTEDSNGFYRKIFPSTFVFNNYDENQIEKFIQRQKIAKQHLKNPWAVIILDDCTDDPSVFRKPLQNGMYKRGRHWKMFYILSLQYGMDIRPVIRTNVDGIFMLREPIQRNREIMYKNYASIIPDFKLFCDILDQITDDYTALYIHNATRSNDWRDCVFWYKAKPVPDDFKFGCKEFWQFHFDRYNQEYVDPLTI